MALRPDREAPPGIPRWVKVFGILIIGLILLFVSVHLLGGGFRGHAPLAISWLALAWA
ncbi:MAG: hypothetical protein ABI847_06850 [Anaerolineales bacterium]